MRWRDVRGQTEAVKTRFESVSVLRAWSIIAKRERVETYGECCVVGVEHEDRRVMRCGGRATRSANSRGDEVVQEL